MPWLRDFGQQEAAVPPAPLRLVVARQWNNSWHGGWNETLECGHLLIWPASKSGAVRRRCAECADASRDQQEPTK